MKVKDLSFVTSGRCTLCDKTIAGGIDLMNYHIWKEHPEQNLKTMEKTYKNMSDSYKSKHSFEETIQMVKAYFREIEKKQEELI
jgi:hypothetical protein